MFDLSLKLMCTEQTPKKFQEYSRLPSARFSLYIHLIHTHYLYYATFSLLLLFFSSIRFCTPMKARVNALRKSCWNRRLTNVQVTSATRATSSSPPCITSLPPATLARGLCGTSSSLRQPSSAAAATQSATKTTWTKRKNKSSPAGVSLCVFYFKNRKDAIKEHLLLLV